MSNGFSVQLDKILSAYDQKVQEVTDQVFQDVAKETVQKLQSTSPRRPGGGTYAAGWSVKKNKKQDIVVYNKVYRLTHLLEKGHVVRNKKGTVGRANAHPHIAPAEEWASNEVQNEIKRRLEG